MAMTDRFDARREQMLNELAKEMAALVETGDMTAQEANECVNRAADRWNNSVWRLAIPGGS